MKKLILCRHAKSSWDDPYLNDHERQLALRGLRDAPYMAQRLKKKGIFPDAILSSDAERAKATALITAENLNFPKEKILFTEKLYHVSFHSLLTEIKKIDNQQELVLLFGHNPGINDLINFLGAECENLPTCGQFGFTFNTQDWTNISPGNAKVWFVDYPKKKPD